MAVLCRAWLVVAMVSFDRWRYSLGMAAQVDDPSDSSLTEARRLAASVERAAAWLPFATKCLPRAVALSWILKRKRIGHLVVIAVRPERLRGSHDDLHAWVEIEGVKLIGDLPGPWLEMLRAGLKTTDGDEEYP